MAQRRKRGDSHESAADQEIREQEVLRANRELAAYFKGRRTEREARAALRIIKAFIRDRERLDPQKRRPLPGATAEPKPAAARKRVPAAKKPRKRRARAASTAHEPDIYEITAEHTTPPTADE